MSFQILSLVFLLFLTVECKKETLTGEIRDITGNYYVSENGSDENSGTKDLPFRTIKKAMESAVPGNIIVVRKGNYDEFITINKSGNSDNERIVFFSETLHGAKCRGFLIKGNYITVDGFSIEAFNPNCTGIEVPGFSYVEAKNNYIHDCPVNGIKFYKGANYAKIINNILEHNGYSGISLSGSSGLIENNTISRTVQYHPKGLGTCSSGSGADADGIRIYGSNHIIRGNRILDIASPIDKGNINPHADCIQTFDAGIDEPVMTNTIIERNYFMVNHPSGSGIMMSALKGNPCHHITIRNNIFEFRNVGIHAILGEFNDIYVYNNLFKAIPNDPVWGASLHFKNVTNYQVFNNITVDCTVDHRKIEGGSGEVDYNLAWNSDNSRIDLYPVQQANEIVGEDPLFISYSIKHGVNNYRLKAGSPAINKGKLLGSVTDDFNGTPRPFGPAYDIGPFEYTGNK